MFWIYTSSPDRNYGLAYSSPRDAGVFAEINGGAHLFASLRNASAPPALLDAKRHLVPRQFAFSRSEGDASVQPQPIFQPGSLTYRFSPTMAVRGRFEKLGGGEGYIWGAGAGYFEYIVPARNDRRRVGQIIVRAHLQPVPPADAKTSEIRTRVTLFVNGTDYGSRLVPMEDPKSPLIQEWRIDKLLIRLRAMRGLPIAIRFVVSANADWPYGVNISNWPAGYESHDAKPLEVEVRRQ